MAAHSSILAWRIPWTEEPGGLQSMGSQRVGDDETGLIHTLGTTVSDPFGFPVKSFNIQGQAFPYLGQAST